jgi:hypothetical protein
MTMVRRAAALVILAIALACGGSAGSGAAPSDRAQPPEGRRVVVEVLNVSRVTGGARIAAVRLRQQPLLDVVYFGSPADSVLAKRERNLIYVRRGDTTGVGAVMAAIGDAEVVDRPDPTRMVDLTVIPGRAFYVGAVR